MSDSTVTTAADEPARAVGSGALALEAARSARDSYRLDYDWRDQEVVRVPDEAVVELIRVLAARVSHRLQQIVPLAPSRLPAGRSAAGPQPLAWGFGTDAATVTKFAQAVSRSLAALNRDVERIYVVPPGGTPTDEVSNQVADDGLNQITSCSLRVSDLRRDSEQQTPVGQVWIVDDGAVMFQEVTEDGPPNWTVSAREADVRRAQRLWVDLKVRSESEQREEVKPGFNLTDPLLVSAELLANTAPMSCTQGNERWEHCDWYHGSWQYLRLFDMVSSPQWHDDFYRRQLSRSIDKLHERKNRPGAGAEAVPRILITGAADYSMFAYVVQALRESSALTHLTTDPPAVHILDLCPTPLLACRWYSRFVEHPIATHELDIYGKWTVKEEFGKPFDLIVTDAFLTRFSFDDCRRVLDRWRELLVPGGRLVTTVRLHGFDAPQTDHMQETAAFVMRAREAARSWRPVLQAGVDAICDGAREYARRITSANLGGLTEVKELFERAGFDVLPGTETSEELPGELRETRYLRIIAERRRSGPGSADRSSGVRGRRRAYRKGDNDAVRRG